MTLTFTKFKKGIALVAVFLMLFTIIPMNANAIETASDISGHWAEETIQEWIDNDWVKGYPDGSFKPDDHITRAEFVALVNRSFQFTATGPISFTDVNQNAWYASAIGIAVRAGYIQGYNDNTMRPENHISREEAATIIMKINNLTANSTAANVFTDSALLTWSKGAVGAVAAANLMTGYPDGTFGPDRMIRRGETVVLLDRSVEYIDEMEAPAAPLVTRNDVTNTVTGMTSAMEYKLDNGVWTSYVASEFNALNLSGNHTLLVRYEAIGILPAGLITTLTFTTASTGGNGGTSVNLAAYNAALVAVVETDYTTDSWTAYQLVVDANVVTTANTQTQINAATLAITTAQADLVLKLAAYNAALAAVDVADYTPETWTAYQLVVEDNVMTTANTQEEIDAATIAIIAAQGDLVLTPTAALAAALAAEALLMPAHYLDYSAVITALALPELDDAQRIAKTTAINSAIAALVLTPEATLLLAAKADAAVRIQTDYSVASWTLFTDAMITANALPETTNTEVVAKTTAINAAMALLTVDNTALTAAITTEVGANHAVPVYVLIAGDYTGDSWLVFTGAVAAAILVEADATATQSEINAATSAIATAKAALVFAGQAALNAAEAEAALLVAADYTPVSWLVLTNALALPETTNAEVVAKTTAINNAIVALELTPEAAAVVTAEELSAVLDGSSQVAINAAQTAHDDALLLVNALVAGTVQDVLLARLVVVQEEIDAATVVLNDADIAIAKTNIEAATYTATQVEAVDAAAALIKAQALVDALGLDLEGTTAVVVAGTFTGAIAGDAITPTGTNGSYTFTVTIDKGLGTQVTTVVQTMTITATPFI